MLFSSLYLIKTKIIRNRLKLLKFDIFKQIITNIAYLCLLKLSVPNRLSQF